MKRFSAISMGMLALFVSLAVGYLAGGSSLGHEAASDQVLADERVVVAFYEVLSGLEETPAQERLAALLAPDFTEQRIDIQQTLDREAFLRAAIQEARTYRGRSLVPTRIGGDGGWIVAIVQTVDAVPGSFVSIALPRSAMVRRELLHVENGQIGSRVVIEGPGSMLRSLAPLQIDRGNVGSQTIKIAQHDYDPNAAERIALAGDTVIVVDRGRFLVQSSSSSEKLEAGDAIRIRAGNEIIVTNEGAAPGRILTLSIAPIEIPTIAASANRTYTSAPGVTVSIVAQSHRVLPDEPCVVVSPGLATMASGSQLPEHRASGFELVVPTSGQLDVRNRESDFLRTDSVRQWQDAVSFATLAPGSGVAAFPESWTTYTASGQDTARFWMFTVEFPQTC